MGLSPSKRRRVNATSICDESEMWLVAGGRFLVSRFFAKRR